MFDHFLHSLLPTVQHFQMLGYWMALLAALLETAIGIGLILPGSTFILRWSKAFCTGGCFGMDLSM